MTDKGRLWSDLGPIKKRVYQNFRFIIIRRWEEEGRGQLLNQGLTWILLLTPVLVPPVGGKLLTELLPGQQELALLREWLHSLKVGLNINLFSFFFGHTGYLCDVGSVTQFDYICICISPYIYLYLCISPTWWSGATGCRESRASWSVSNARPASPPSLLRVPGSRTRAKSPCDLEAMA